MMILFLPSGPRTASLPLALYILGMLAPSREG